jgi:hypothetical protein
VARALRRGAILVGVLVIVYVALAGYSLSKFRPNDVGASALSSPELVGQQLSLGAQLNLTNPGILPINSLSIAASVRFSNGTLIASAAPASVSIPAGATAHLPLALSVPLSTSGGDLSLLTADQTLVVRFNVNVTYATVFTAALQANSNYSWGAPFSRLNVTPGSPIPGPGSNVSLPLTISFSDHAASADRGTITIALTMHPAGCPSSSTTIGLNVPPQGSYSQTTDFNTTRNCIVPGQQVALTYSGPGFTFTFPPQSLP